MRLLSLAIVVALTATLQRPVAYPDLAYGADPRQRLDFTTPARGDFATVLFVHGGSFTTGSKSDEDYRGVCAPLVAAGIACASMNYRLFETAPWPAQAHDVASAIAFLLKEIEGKRGNARQVFLIGHSSGAMLVALIAADASYLRARGLTSDVIRGVIPIGSIMLDEELEQVIMRMGRDHAAAAFLKSADSRGYTDLDAYRQSWPIRHVRKGMPPILFLIGDAEQDQPPILKTNRQFVDAARALGNVADVRVMANRTHYGMLRGWTQTGDPVVAAIREFVTRLSARP